MAESNTRIWLNRLGAFAPVLTLLTLVVVFGVQTDSFLTRANIYNIFAQAAPLGIMAIGITFVLICAEIDLSIASMATLGGVICASLFDTMGGASTATPSFFQSYIPIMLAIFACGGLGLVNGVCTAFLGIPSFMASISMMLIASGLALRITQGRPLLSVPPVLDYIGNGAIELFATDTGHLIVVPRIAVVAAVFMAIAAIVLRYVRFGRHIYAVGSNPEAAELSGINRRIVLTSCLCLCGFTAGAAGVVLIGRMGSAQATGYDGMLMDCIAAVVLGGTSLFGGKGGIGFTIIGLLTLVSLKNGLNHLDIDIFSKEYINGIILLSALILNITIDRLRSAR